MFSREPLPPELLQQLFGSSSEVVGCRSWAAYPAFSPPESLAPFDLAAGLCYINSIESAASAMEVGNTGGGGAQWR